MSQKKSKEKRKKDQLGVEMEFLSYGEKLFVNADQILLFIKAQEGHFNHIIGQNAVKLMADNLNFYIQRAKQNQKIIENGQ